MPTPSSSPGLLQKFVNTLAGKLGSKDGGSSPADRLKRLGLSERQQELNYLWGVYRNQQYAGRKIGWDGKEATGRMDTDFISTQGFLPPGFMDQSKVQGNSLPLKFRRPTAPYALVKVIVDRFTGLLFSENRHPEVKVDGDEDTQDWLRALADATRVWQNMIQARTFGGAMGTAVVGFQFIQGKPVIEVHDPRWCYPEFTEYGSTVLRSIEKRYQYPKEERDPATGRWEKKLYWYRRVIDETSDVLYEPAPVDQGDEPQWTEAKRADHGFGFCPVIWVQNLPLQDSEDGDPDCSEAVYDNVVGVDALISQSYRGIIANCFGIETRFITEAGVRAFRDFKDGTRIKVLTHTGALKPAVVKSFGRQRLQVVTMQRGPSGRPVVVRATPDHRWLLPDGLETTALAVGDRLLAAPSKFSEFEYDSATPEEQAFWRRGFIWGDGSASTTGGKIYGCNARLCGAKVKYVARFVGGDFRVNYPPSADGEPVVSSSENMKCLPAQDTAINLLRAFVRGYVDADGTASHKKSSRWKRIQVTGEASCNFVRQVFPAVGLYISCEKPVTEATNFGLRGAHTVRFELNENASSHWNSEWRVTAIEACAFEEEVWCLQTEDDRSIVLPEGIASGQCDPTIVITSKAEMAGGVSVGSDNAIRVPEGDAKFLELTASGPKAAMEMADQLRKHILEMASCVLEHPDEANKTATEVQRNYEAMLAKADVLREQYGQKCVVPLLEMMWRAATALNQPKVLPQPEMQALPGGEGQLPTGQELPGDAPAEHPNENAGAGAPGSEETEADLTEGVLKPQQATTVRLTVLLPPRYEKGVDGIMVAVERQLGTGGTISLKWPGYFQPGAQDLQFAVTACVAALTGGIIDDETAIGYVAPFFKAEDVAGLVDKVRANAAQQSADLMAQMQSATGQPPGHEPAPGMPGAPGFPVTQ